MAIPGSTANGVFVIMPTNSAGIIQQHQGVSGVITETSQMVQYGSQQSSVMNHGSHLGAMYPGSQAEQVAQLKQEGMMAIFLKAQPKTLGAIQILTGLQHIGFGVISALFLVQDYSSISVIGGYPFWGGIFFVISGSLSVAAENHRNPHLVRCSLGMNITSAVFSAIGIVLFLADLILNDSYYDYQRDLCLSGVKGIAVMLLLSTILEFCITISTSRFACQAIRYTPNTQAMVFMPYTVNANVGVPSTPMTQPPPYTSVACDPKEETEQGAS